MVAKVAQKAALLNSDTVRQFLGGSGSINGAGEEDPEDFS